MVLVRSRELARSGNAFPDPASESARLPIGRADGSFGWIAPNDRARPRVAADVQRGIRAACRDRTCAAIATRHDAGHRLSDRQRMGCRDGHRGRHSCLERRRRAVGESGLDGPEQQGAWSRSAQSCGVGSAWGIRGPITGSTNRAGLCQEQGSSQARPSAWRDGRAPRGRPARPSLATGSGWASPRRHRAAGSSGSGWWAAARPSRRAGSARAAPRSHRARR